MNKGSSVKRERVFVSSQHQLINLWHGGVFRKVGLGHGSAPALSSRSTRRRTKKKKKFPEEVVQRTRSWVPAPESVLQEVILRACCACYDDVLESKLWSTSSGHRTSSSFSAFSSESEISETAVKICALHRRPSISQFGARWAAWLSQRRMGALRGMNPIFAPGAYMEGRTNWCTLAGIFLGLGGRSPRYHGPISWVEILGLCRVRLVGQPCEETSPSPVRLNRRPIGGQTVNTHNYPLAQWSDRKGSKLRSSSLVLLRVAWRRLSVGVMGFDNRLHLILRALSLKRWN